MHIRFQQKQNEEQEETGFIDFFKYTLLTEFDTVSFRVVINEGKVERIMADITNNDTSMYSSLMLPTDYDGDDYDGYASRLIESVKETLYD